MQRRCRDVSLCTLRLLGLPSLLRRKDLKENNNMTRWLNCNALSFVGYCQQTANSYDISADSERKHDFFFKIKKHKLCIVHVAFRVTEYFTAF